MNKKAIETVIAIIFLIIFEGFLILAGPSLWGRDKAYHIWGNANMLLCFGTAIFSVIIRMLKKNKKDDHAKGDGTGAV